MNILILNPGGNSLKVELIATRPGQRYAFEAVSLLSVAIEGIGRDATLARMEGKKAVRTEWIAAPDYAGAAASFLRWYQEHAGDKFPALDRIEGVAVRVVHGGEEFNSATLIDAEVESRIRKLEELAPLHNKNSLELLGPLRRRLGGVPVYGVFDTAFHRTIPEYASTYAIPLDLAAKHGIRRYGFHGISHRYLLERYAHLAGKDPSGCSIVSTHLESGCSVTAVQQGKSVDNTMGLTPLEGLMMGTRSGDVDPSLIPLLMRAEGMEVDDIMELLNRRSGLLGVSRVSLDTRVLMQKYDSNPQVKLAMDMFAYRVRKAVGAYLAVLGKADALIFGGGIAENGVFVRRYVCEGLRSFGIEMDTAANEQLIDREGLLSTAASPVAAWVIPTEEGLQMAHECSQAIGGATSNEAELRLSSPQTGSPRS